MGTEVGRVSDQLNRAFRADAWHGPAVMEILADVTAEQAAARPLANAHTIWELVKHMAYWKEVVRERIGGAAPETDEARNFPVIRDPSPRAWVEALADLEREHAALREAVEALEDGQLDEPPPGGRSVLYVQIHGMVQHDLYHAGQIVLLKKALAGAPARPRVARAAAASGRRVKARAVAAARRPKGGAASRRGSAGTAKSPKGRRRRG